MPKYGSYEEAVNAEKLRNLDLQNKELEKRMKLEESLNVLATIAIIAIIIGTIIGIIFITGVLNLSELLGAEASNLVSESGITSTPIY